MDDEQLSMGLDREELGDHHTRYNSRNQFLLVQCVEKNFLDAHHAHVATAGFIL
jgi:hypothetical protein